MLAELTSAESCKQRTAITMCLTIAYTYYGESQRNNVPHVEYQLAHRPLSTYTLYTLYSIYSTYIERSVVRRIHRQTGEAYTPTDR